MPHPTRLHGSGGALASSSPPNSLFNRGQPPPFAVEQQSVVIERFAIHDRDRLGLIGDALQPMPLGCGPAAGGQDPLQRLIHPLIVGH
jgi:hypothetical protein